MSNDATKKLKILTSQNFEGSRFSNSIGAHKPQNASRPRGRQPMQLKGICRVSMCRFFAQIRRQIDNSNGLKRAFFDTNTTSYAQFFRNEGNFVVWCHFYAKFTHSNNWARLFAFLPTSFWLTFIIIYNSNSS